MRVDDTLILGRAAGQHIDDILCHLALDAHNGVLGIPGHVVGEDQIVAAQQRVALLRRLDLNGINAGCTDRRALLIRFR